MQRDNNLSMLHVTLNELGRLGFSKCDILPGFKERCFRANYLKEFWKKSVLKFTKILKKNIRVETFFSVNVQACNFTWNNYLTTHTHYHGSLLQSLTNCPKSTELLSITFCTYASKLPKESISLLFFSQALFVSN